MKSVCVCGGGVAGCGPNMKLSRTLKNTTVEDTSTKTQNWEDLSRNHCTGAGDESVLLGDDFQTFDQNRWLSNTTFATLRAVPRPPSVRMYIFETKVHFTSWVCSHINRYWYLFFVSKTHENLKHSETIKMTRHKQPILLIQKFCYINIFSKKIAFFIIFFFSEIFLLFQVNLFQKCLNAR